MLVEERTEEASPVLGMDDFCGMRAMPCSMTATSNSWRSFHEICCGRGTIRPLNLPRELHSLLIQKMRGKLKLLETFQE
jgi:hypothetical protein